MTMEDNKHIKVKTEKELGEALNSDADVIEIEGKLGDKVFKIKVTGKVAWGVCIGAIAISVTAILATPATGGSSDSALILTIPTAALILGAPVAISAVAIAVAAGSIGALNKLRKYKIAKHEGDILILTRK